MEVIDLDLPMTVVGIARPRRPEVEHRHAEEAEDAAELVLHGFDGHVPHPLGNVHTDGDGAEDERGAEGEALDVALGAIGHDGACEDDEHRDDLQEHHDAVDHGQSPLQPIACDGEQDRLAEDGGGIAQVHFRPLVCGRNNSDGGGEDFPSWSLFLYSFFRIIIWNMLLTFFDDYATFSFPLFFCSLFAFLSFLCFFSESIFWLCYARCLVLLVELIITAAGLGTNDRREDYSPRRSGSDLIIIENAEIKASIDLK
mmetsp:Transcript_4772/g.6678  ORF Transcript_4772/g.6678 Transcript_4772/m.6678 type:complete len:256 (+) Transcript_4772:382-1149(+)